MKNFTFLLVFFLLLSCNKTPEVVDVIDTEFSGEKQVTIQGYDGNAMEPFITKDDKYLFFNSEADDNGKDLYYARKIDDTTFEFLGKISGVNTEDVDANPTMDADSNFFFISTRDYDSEKGTIYMGQFANGTVTNVQKIEGDIEETSLFWLNMGVEISITGDTMFVSTAKFGIGATFPSKGDIHYAVRQDGQYNIPDDEPEILSNINTDYAVEYAGEMSTDGLELFYSQVTLTDPPRFKLYHSKRTSTDQPFGKPTFIKVPFEDNEFAFVEAPTLSADGKRLYYHKLVDGKFKIFMLKRK